MNCPRCGRSVTPGGAFCPHCGQALAPARPAPTQMPTQMPTGMPREPHAAAAAHAGVASLQNDFDAQRKRSLIFGAGIAGILLVMGLIFGFKALGNLGAQGGKPDPSLNAAGNLPAPVLQSRSNLPAPILNRGDERPEPLKMPADVLDWLKHLEKCEAIKIEITGDQQVEMQTYMTKLSLLGADIGLTDPFEQTEDQEGDKSPDAYTKGKVLDMRPRWQQLITFFNSKVPPAECRPLADDFNHAIQEIPGMSGDIADILNNVASDPAAALSKVRKMQNKSNGEIDRYFLRADEKLGRICNKYNVNQWFNIKADVGGGMLGRFSSVGGGGAGGMGAIGGAGIPGGAGLPGGQGGSLPNGIGGGF